MKRALSFLLLIGAFAHPLPAATDEEVAAHKAVFDLAGAFTNDGFRLRDGSFTGVIQPKGSAVVQVNLYAGNQYWFSVGANDKALKLSVVVFDETGKEMATEPYQDDAKAAADVASTAIEPKSAKAAAGFAPAVSGPYYVRVQELEGDAASFCLIYSYK